MRRLVFVFLIVIVTMSILWLWRGRDLSMLIDRFELIETNSRPIKTITYEGNGTGGILHVENLDLSLNDVELGAAQPSIGTTKDDQLALSFGGKVFRLGRHSQELEVSSRQRHRAMLRLSPCNIVRSVGPTFSKSIS